MPLEELKKKKKKRRDPMTHHQKENAHNVKLVGDQNRTLLLLISAHSLKVV
jgi:hypothetical protein